MLAIAGPLGESWESLDAWPLFTEDFHVIIAAGHRLAGPDPMRWEDLHGERLLARPYCELAGAFSELARERDLKLAGQHAMGCEDDLMQLADAELGVGILPQTTPCPDGLRRIRVDGLDITRTVYLYAVAGRERTVPATALMKLLRAKDWTPHLAAAT